MDARIIVAMGDFAATTKNDAMSVHVARIVQKLQNAGKQFEAPLHADYGSVQACYCYV